MGAAATGFSLGPMPIAYFLCAALQKRLELKRAIPGTTAFSALLILRSSLMIAPFPLVRSQDG